MLSVSFVFVFHVSPPAVRVGLGWGTQPIDETLGLGKRCTEGFGVCFLCAVLGDIQHNYLHKRSAVMERDGVVKVPREIMPDFVLSLVGCRTVCCHLWDAGLCVVTCARAVSKSCRRPILGHK